MVRHLELCSDVDRWLEPILLQPCILISPSWTANTPRELDVFLFSYFMKFACDQDSLYENTYDGPDKFHAVMFICLPYLLVNILSPLLRFLSDRL